MDIFRTEYEADFMFYEFVSKMSPDEYEDFLDLIVKWYFYQVYGWEMD